MNTILNTVHTYTYESKICPFFIQHFKQNAKQNPEAGEQKRQFASYFRCEFSL